MVNYIELTINGKIEKLPIRVSYLVLKRFKAETGRDLDNFENITDIEPILFYALEAGHKAENKEMPFKRDEFEYIIDENFKHLVNNLSVIMADFAAGEPANDKTKKKIVE